MRFYLSYAYETHSLTRLENSSVNRWQTMQPVRSLGSQAIGRLIIKIHSHARYSQRVANKLGLAEQRDPKPLPGPNRGLEYPQLENAALGAQV